MAFLLLSSKGNLSSSDINCIISLILSSAIDLRLFSISAFSCFTYKKPFVFPSLFLIFCPSSDCNFEILCCMFMIKSSTLFGRIYSGTWIDLL
jgi:hypothetical protein